MHYSFGDFMYDILIGSFINGDFIEIVLALVMWILCLALGFVVLGFIFEMIDSVGMPDLQGKGKIIKKYKNEAHTTTTFTKVGNSTIPQTHYHPTRRYVVVEIDGRKDDVCVNKKFYKQAEFGMVVDCIYNLGRLSNDSLYISEIK